MVNINNKVIKIELSDKVWREIVLFAQMDEQFGITDIKLVEDDY